MDNGILIAIITGAVAVITAILAGSFKLAQISITNKMRKEKEYKNKVFKDIIEKHEIVETLNMDTLKLFKADRLCIYEYHNGQKLRGDIPFFKVSMTFEETAEGISKKFQIMQNIPMSFFAYINMKLINKEFLEINDIESLKNFDIGLYEILKTDNVKSFYSIGLYDYMNLPIGFISLEYCKDFKQFTSTEKDIFLNISYRLSGLLN